MLLPKELSLTNVMFERDCLHVVNAVNSRLPTHDAISPIVFDIYQLVDDESNWKVSYASRELNRGVDCLANYACITLLDSVWVKVALLVLST